MIFGITVSEVMEEILKDQLEMAIAKSISDYCLDQVLPKVKMDNRFYWNINLNILGLSLSATAAKHRWKAGK